MNNPVIATAPAIVIILQAILIVALGMAFLRTTDTLDRQFAMAKDLQSQVDAAWKVAESFQKTNATNEKNLRECLSNQQEILNEQEGK